MRTSWSEGRREMGGRLLPFRTHYFIQSNNPKAGIVAGIVCVSRVVQTQRFSLKN